MSCAARAPCRVGTLEFPASLFFDSEKKIGRKANVEAWVGGTSLGLHFGRLGGSPEEKGKSYFV